MNLQIDQQETLAARLKRVLRQMPAPVALVTSFDPANGDPVGLAVSALMPICIAPCAMAICVNRSGFAHERILGAGRFCINLLGPDQAFLMRPFADASARSERFLHSDWAMRDQIMYVRTGPAAIFCTIRQHLSHGTHDLLVGDVDAVCTSNADSILGWCNGALGQLRSLA